VQRRDREASPVVVSELKKVGFFDKLPFPRFAIARSLDVFAIDDRSHAAAMIGRQDAGDGAACRAPTESMWSDF